jgi:ATP-dependent phosphoenolpyruvate carboxykinase
MTNLSKFSFIKDISHVLNNCKSVTVPKSRAELIPMAFGDQKDSFEVSYDVDGKKILEATVMRCKNGAAVNYAEDYMRRRDPDCLIVSDELSSDKLRFKDVYKQDFSSLRNDTFKWLEKQELIVMPFMAGGKEYGYEAILVAPKNAAFFACGLAGLQHFVNIDEFDGTFAPKAVIYLAPPFRHTHFDGKQIVVHNRLSDIYEMFSYNLYPGPSAKKGVYGFLLNIGEKEGWVTAHASAVKVITPYENEIVIMHEGASGGGKSEMGENIHREPNGKILIGQNLDTKEKFYLNINEPCELQPIADDMALCHPKMQGDSKKLVIQDAENGWFLRLNVVKP